MVSQQRFGTHLTLLIVNGEAIDNKLLSPTTGFFEHCEGVERLRLVDLRRPDLIDLSAARSSSSSSNLFKVSCFLNNGKGECV